MSTVRLSGRGARFVQLLHDFGHIDSEGADRLLVAVAELHTELGGELDEPADVDLVRRAAAMLFAPPGEDSISPLLEEDWPLLFS